MTAILGAFRGLLAILAIALPAIALPAIALPFVAFAAETCPEFFANGQTPVIGDPKLDAETVRLCFGAFAVLYSPISRTPLYAAERLTRASVSAARDVERTDAFHEEERLPAAARSTLEDYLRSGYDRGHLAPAGDMPTPETLAESFSLANIVPQNRSQNRSIWAAIEESVRRLATRRRELFVVTGTVFSGRTVPSLDERVLVPTQLFKAVYDPVRGEAGAYLAPNDAEGAWKPVSMDALAELSGIEVFPGLPRAARTRAMTLPEPRIFSRERGRGQEASFEAWLRAEAYKLLRGIWRDLLRAILRG